MINLEKNNSFLPILHFDKEKGIKYVFNPETKTSISYLEDKDIQYIHHSCEKIEKVVNQNYQYLQQTKKEILQVEKDVNFLKNLIEEKRIQFEKFDPNNIDVKILQLKNDVIEKFEAQKKEMGELINQNELNNLVKTHEELQTKIKKTLEEAERCLAESDTIIKGADKLLLKKKFNGIIYYLGVGLLINFGGLILCYSTLLAKKGGGLLVFYAMKTINLTGYKIHPPEN